jgi:diphthamide synthase (EF-2-diphthine--ammonia ligase)
MQLASFPKRMKNRRYLIMIKTWEKLFKKLVVYGKYEYQAYAKDNQYEVVRYGEDGEYDTVLLGNFYKCETKQDKLQYIIDDMKGLAEQLQEEFDSVNTK